VLLADFCVAFFALIVPSCAGSLMSYPARLCGGTPSGAAYTVLAVAMSDTGCSTDLTPWVEEQVMFTPEAWWRCPWRSL
jgi:hypothetical protein